MRKYLKTPDVRSTVVVVLAVGFSVGIFGLLTGCRSNAGSKSHAMLGRPAWHDVKCRLCYDESVRVKHAVPAKASVGVSRYTYIAKHMCPGCKAASDIYRQAGELTFKCKGCAPEGVLCDICASPKKGRLFARSIGAPTG